MNAPNEHHRTAVEILAAVNTAAAELLCAPPRRAAALAYLRQRGLCADAVPPAWPLGYAPPGWTRLVDSLSSRFPPQALLESGLARPSSRGGLIDAFRDRVIFPVLDRGNRVIGFLGRDTSADPCAPKYLNTPRTALYHKSAVLYGLAQAGRGRQPVLVEGPLDVLAVATSVRITGDGDLVPVAACGTAFTAIHARALAGFVHENRMPVVVAFDADPAGRSAALRAGAHLHNLGVDVRIAHLATGTDPAEHLSSASGDLKPFRAGHALPLFQAQVEQAITKQGDRMQWIEGRLGAARAIATQLATYPASYAATQIGWLANTLDLDANTVTLEVVNAFRDARPPRQLAHPRTESRDRECAQLVNR